MLMDCLAAGRAISLPALGTGAAMFCARYGGAYARIRRQFGLPIGRFEGIEAPLARIAGYAYGLEAARRLTAATLDKGEQPSVLSAILKYHATERMRIALNDALDIHGGRAICDGPRNYLFGTYMSVPVAITVEGANILTRSLIIFGQGAIRCHPYLLKQMEAANASDPNEGLKAFDKALFGHIGSATSNVVRAFWHNLTFGRFARTPDVRPIGHMYRGLHTASVTFAAVADLVMATLGGEMKRREALSGRMGDVLSELYLTSCVLKRFEDDGMPEADLAFVEWNYRSALYTIQTRLDEVLKNLPSRPVAWLLRMIAFPLGRHRRPPPDSLSRALAQVLLAPSDTRDRLTKGIYISRSGGDATGRMELALEAAVERDRIEAKVRRVRPDRKALADLDLLVSEEVITKADAEALENANAIVRDVIDVDDFAPSEIAQAVSSSHRSAEAAE
jgi:acyl-CoA dehydrogenase